MEKLELSEIVRVQHLKLNQATEQFKKGDFKNFFSYIEDVQQVQYRLEQLEKQLGERAAE